MNERRLVSRPGELVFEDRQGRTAPSMADLVDRETRLDARTLAARVALRSPADTNATTWQGIRAIGVDRGGAIEAVCERPPSDVERAPEYLRRAMQASVERSLAGATRVAVMTGGGVDSSVLLALATEWAKRDRARSAFGVAVDFGGAGDDRPHLAALERHLGCEIVRVRPEDAAARFDLFERGVDASPFTWPGGPFEVEALSRARELGADRCAMGAGADELFDGVPESLADVAGTGRLLEAFARARKMRAFARPPRTAYAWVLRPLIARRVPRRLRAWRLRRSTPAVEAWAGPLLRTVLAEIRAREIAALPSGGEDANARFERWRSALDEEHIVWLRHQEQMAARVVRRDPFDDPTLARAVTRLPPSWLLHGDIRRGLFREAVRGLVPDSLRLREDKAYFEEGFTRFVGAVGGFARLRPLARAGRLADLGIVEPRLFGEAFEELAANPIDSWGWGTVWPALAVEAFLRSVEEPR